MLHVHVQYIIQRTLAPVAPVPISFFAESIIASKEKIV